jgi:periplasmic protein TonB
MARSPDGPAVPTARTAPAPPVRLAHPGTLDLSFDPRLGGSLAPSSTVLMEGVPVSTDWLNEVSAWWQRHAYYPPQAGLNNEDGDVTLHMRVDRDGHVTHLELVSKSGSQWLDLGALAIFRDAYLPPLPPGTSEAQIPFHVTIHFVIVR